VKQPRVLLVAEAANPEWVSIPLEGWSHSRAIARLVPSHLVTQVRNREAILRAGLIEGVDFTSINSEAVATVMCRLSEMLRGGAGKGWTTSSALYTLSCYYFERLVWAQFGSRIATGEFSLVHRLTPLSPTIPSLLATKCRSVGVPFVMGPINGGLPWPRQFDSERRRENEWLSYVRDAYRLLPGYRSTLRDARAVLVGSKHTLSQLPRQFRDKYHYVPENGVDPRKFGILRTRRADIPLRVVFIGRMVPYKGGDMLIEACAALIRQGLVKLELVGDGPERSALEMQVKRLDLQTGVTFHGWKEHEEIQKLLASTDLLAFPSVREFGGAVALEAMAVGVPAMVIDYGGPSELVTEETGWKIPLGSRSQIVDRFSRTLASISANPGVIDEKGAKAVARVRATFTWDAKAHNVLDIYDGILREARCRCVA
jgi:glycosyltransferase involved in cell wall biosynthesis